MTRPLPTDDPFSDGFDADDDFGPAPTSRAARAQALGGQPGGYGTDDPFAAPQAGGYRPAPAQPAYDPEPPLSHFAAESDPFAAQPRQAAPQQPFAQPPQPQPQSFAQPAPSVAAPPPAAPAQPAARDPYTADFGQPAAAAPAAAPFGPFSGQAPEPQPRAREEFRPEGYDAVELGPRDAMEAFELTPAPPREKPKSEIPFSLPTGFNPVGELVAGAEAALQEFAVPRITIHVFGEKAETLTAADKAAADRRLNRATCQVRPGGLSAAVEAYQHEPTPSLVVVESAAPPTTLLAELDRLAEVCDPSTKVVVIGAQNDIALYRELMRRGVSEYLVPPVAPLSLIQAVATLFTDPSAPFVGRTIAFVGARGGVGSSTIAHNTAFAVSERMSSNTIIVDYDLPFGTAGLDFNQDPMHGIVDALAHPDRLDPVLMDRMMARCTDRLSLFAAPATLDSDFDVPAESFEEVTQKIRTTAPFVVLDLPHVWTAWMKRTLLSADEVVIVATPDLASLRNAKNMIDLVRQGRPNDAPPRLVLNQVGVPGRPEIPVKDFGAAMGVQPCLVLPFDAKLFGKAANNGQMILEVAAKTKPAEGFAYLAQVVTGREAPATQARSGGLGKMFKR